MIVFTPLFFHFNPHNYRALCSCIIYNPLDCRQPLIKQGKKFLLGALCSWGWRHYDIRKCRELISMWRSVLLWMSKRKHFLYSSLSWKEFWTREDAVTFSKSEPLQLILRAICNKNIILTIFPYIYVSRGSISIFSVTMTVSSIWQAPTGPTEAYFWEVLRNFNVFTISTIEL